MPGYDCTFGNYRNPSIKSSGLMPHHLLVRYSISNRAIGKNVVDNKNCLKEQEAKLLGSERVTQRRKLDPREKNKV